MAITTTTAVYPNKDMGLSGDSGSLKIAYLVIFSLVFVLGVLGNGVVIWATAFKMRRTVNTVWYLNLAVADFLVTAFLPLRITYTALDERWPFGNFLCKLDHVVFFTNMYAGVYILAAISVDRCVRVVRPVWAQNHRSVGKASCVSLGVWVLALALSSSYFMFSDKPKMSYRGKDIIWCYHKPAPTDDVATPADQLSNFRFGAMIMTHFLVGFVVPVTAIVSCYSVVIYRLRKNRALARRSARPFKIIATVIAAFVLCWAPFHVMYQLAFVNFLVTEYSETLDRVVTVGIPITTGLALLNGCLNPLLYVFMGQDFKDVFRRSVLKVLEKAFTEEEPPQTNIYTTISGSGCQETALSETQV